MLISIIVIFRGIYECFFTPKLEKYISKQVESGFYHSSSEVVRASLRLLITSESKNSNIELENYKMWLNGEIQVGLDQVTQGKLISGEKALQNIKNFHKEQLKANV